MKLKRIYERILSETSLKFDTYQDFLDYIRNRVKEQGQRYYTTPEYKELYPQGQKLHAIEKRGFVDKKAAEMGENGVNVGDKIEIVWGTMFGGSDSIVGIVFMKGGVPYVKLPHKMSVSVKGKIVQKGSLPYSSKNMRKI